MRVVKLGAIVFLSLLALGTVGCSKSKSEASSSATTPKGNSASSITTTTVAGGGIPAGTCPSQADIDSINNKMNELYASDSGGTYQQFGQEMVNGYQLIGNYIPENLKADFKVIDEAVSQMANSVANMTGSPANPSTDDMAALQAALAPLQSTEVQASTQKIDDYFKTACPGLNLEGSDSTTSTTA